MAITSLLVAAAQVLGPVLGGLLIAAFDWRAVFLVNLPIGLLGLALTVTTLREEQISQPRRGTERFDLLGAGLSILAIGILLMALEQIADHPTSPIGLVLLIAGIVTLVVFTIVERRVPQPLLALELFRARPFGFGSFAVACALLATAAIAFVMPFYLQIVLGYSPLQSGLLLTPTALGIVLAGPAAGWLSNRVGARTLASVGLLIGVGAIAWISRLDTDSHYSDVAVRLTLLGIGMGLFHPPNNVSVLSVTPPERMSIAAAFLSTMRMLGQFVGASLTAEILGTHLDRVGGLEAVEHGTSIAAHDDVVDAFLAGQTLALQVTACLVLIGVLASVLRGASSRQETRGAGAGGDRPAPRPPPVTAVPD
jgi:MFS family permease